MAATSSARPVLSSTGGARSIAREEAARTLWARAGIQVLPGAYLSREVDGHNPGRGFIRVALVADADATEPALQRLRAVLYDETTGGEG